MNQTSDKADANPSGAFPANEVLFVDLDGTLIASDMLVESLLMAVKSDPKLLMKLPFLLLRGRAALKRAVAELASPDPARLPYRSEVIEFIAERRQAGCRIVLATASDIRFAQGVAEHLGVFDDFLGSDGQTNLKGPAKLAAIEAYCRQGGYSTWSYVGDSSADLPIWASATHIYAVEPSKSLTSSVEQLDAPAQVVVERRARWPSAVRAMRPQQWVKNFLIFVPVLLAHQLQAGPIIAAILAFAAFSVCASAVYIVNDLLDIEADRQHPHKSRRPFASGNLPLPYGPPLAAGLFLGGEFLAASCLGWRFVAILTAYIAATTAYSFWLKREPIVDVLTLSGLYTIRIFAGGVAAGVPISEWLAAFSAFLFLSLALVKRYSELIRLTRESRTASAGRGYLTTDLGLLQTLGAVSGYLAVLVFALYTNSPAMKSLYRHPWALWMICPLMIYWISRIWLIAAREELGEDPVVFAVKDRVSLLIGVLAVIAVAIACLPG